MKKKVVEVTNLGFTYPDGTPALNRISFSVLEGESMALIGPNGAGKSTLLLHLNGVLRGNGEVRILGEPIGKNNLREVRSKVGLVFQDPNDQLFMPTLLDDVAFGPLNLGWTEEEAVSASRRILKELDLPGFEGRPPHHLSLGEKKKASLATVLVMEPEILVLDEPTSNLDPGSRRNLLSILGGFKKTKIIATHDLDMAWELGSRVILMDKGRLIAEGRPEDMLRNRKLLAAHNLEVPLSSLYEAGSDSA